mmetsp:Transcript_10923/g.19921  ORF Transcript_10923/g.19921 Transcript_10923/m.19921 type:complete len:270 (+) Transcript_10923:785-1594(+)
MKQNLPITPQPPSNLTRLPIRLHGLLHLLHPNTPLRSLTLSKTMRNARLDTRPNAMVGHSTGSRINRRSQLVQPFGGARIAKGILGEVRESDAGVGEHGENRRGGGGGGCIILRDCEGCHVLKYITGGITIDTTDTAIPCGIQRRMVQETLVEGSSLVERRGGCTCQPCLFELYSETEGAVGFSCGGGDGGGCAEGGGAGAGASASAGVGKEGGWLLFLPASYYGTAAAAVGAETGEGCQRMGIVDEEEDEGDAYERPRIQGTVLRHLW